MTDDLKTKGNAAFNANHYEEALVFYSAALELDSQNAVLFCSCSAARRALGYLDLAESDARTA
jgi:stress-induced-phosphoprotein 1